MMHEQDGWGASREDVLIGRVVDGEASQQDFDELERLGSADPEVWRRLATAQRAHARLERAVEDRIALAELIELPRQRWLGGGGVIAKIGLAGGWLAAAALGVVVFTQMGASPTAPVTTGQGVQSEGSVASGARLEDAFADPEMASREIAALSSDGVEEIAEAVMPADALVSSDAFTVPARRAARGDREVGGVSLARTARGEGLSGLEYVSLGPLLTTATTDEAFRQYLLSGIAEGRVIAEMPSQLVEVREGSGGGVQEVYLIRRTLERLPASEIWVPEIRMDDAGNVLSVPVRLLEGATEMEL